MENLIITLILVPVLLVIIFESAGVATYGWFINSKKVMPYLVKSRPSLRLNSLSSNIIFGFGGLTYASKSGLGIFYKWHISDLGIVPRWSKAHRYLNKVHKELLFQSPDKYERVFK